MSSLTDSTAVAAVATVADVSIMNHDIINIMNDIQCFQAPYIFHSVWVANLVLDVLCLSQHESFDISSNVNANNGFIQTQIPHHEHCPT